MASKNNINITIVVDTREQAPLDFEPFAAFGITTVRAKLNAGDYAVKGYEGQMFVERKSLNDLVSTLTHGRDRFLREVYDRGAFVPCKHIVVEASWQDISKPYTFSAANPLAIVNSLYSLMMPPTTMHVFASRSRSLCAWYVANVCANFVRRATHGSRGLWNAVNSPSAADIPPLPCPYESIS